jgi:hypothetical protein
MAAAVLMLFKKLRILTYFDKAAFSYTNHLNLDVLNFPSKLQTEMR